MTAHASTIPPTALLVLHGTEKSVFAYLQPTAAPRTTRGTTTNVAASATPILTTVTTTLHLQLNSGTLSMPAVLGSGTSATVLALLDQSIAHLTRESLTTFTARSPETACAHLVHKAVERTSTSTPILASVAAHPWTATMGSSGMWRPASASATNKVTAATRTSIGTWRDAHASVTRRTPPPTLALKTNIIILKRAPANVHKTKAFLKIQPVPTGQLRNVPGSVCPIPLAPLTSSGMTLSAHASASLAPAVTCRSGTTRTASASAAQ